MELIKSAPKLTGVDARIVLQDMYETTYKVYNHIGASKKRPLASVALHESEDNTHTSSLYEAIETYNDKGIKDIFNLSLIEYLNLPADICIKITEVCSRESKKTAGVLSGIENSLNNKEKK